jgi:hypothetical protein
MTNEEFLRYLIDPNRKNSADLSKLPELPRTLFGLFWIDERGHIKYIRDLKGEIIRFFSAYDAKIWRNQERYDEIDGTHFMLLNRNQGLKICKIILLED